MDSSSYKNSCPLAKYCKAEVGSTVEGSCKEFEGSLGLETCFLKTLNYKLSIY